MATVSECDGTRMFTPAVTADFEPSGSGLDEDENMGGGGEHDRLEQPCKAKNGDSDGSGWLKVRPKSPSIKKIQFLALCHGGIQRTEKALISIHIFN